MAGCAAARSIFRSSSSLQSVVTTAASRARSSRRTSFYLPKRSGSIAQSPRFLRLDIICSLYWLKEGLICWVLLEYKLLCHFSVPLFNLCLFAVFMPACSEYVLCGLNATCLVQIQ
jgi:hypothetical protein